MHYTCLSFSLDYLFKFLSNFYIPPCVKKVFNFMEFIFVENALIQGIFTHVPSHSTPSPLQVLVFTPQAEGNFSFPQAAFFRKSVERGGGNYVLPYQKSIRKYEDDLEHQVFFNIRYLLLLWLLLCKHVNLILKLHAKK